MRERTSSSARRWMHIITFVLIQPIQHARLINRSISWPPALLRLKIKLSFIDLDLLFSMFYFVAH